MKFIIYFYNADQCVGSQNVSGGMQSAEIVAASGLILHSAVRATINDAQSDELLKVVRGARPQVANSA